MTDSLIDAKTLLDRLEDPDVSLLEVSSGRTDDEYRKGHIPGAAWANWQELLWDGPRREFPSPEDLSRKLGALGLGDASDLVVYGSSVAFGTYAYWALSLRGQRNVYVLDGGKDYWLDAGLPLNGGRAKPEPGSDRPYGPEDPSIRLRRDEILARLGSASLALIDVRSAEEYRGERDTGSQRVGHIPGARNLFYEKFVHDDGTLRSKEEVLDALGSVAVAPDDEIGIYCIRAHRSSLVWFALTKVAGVPNARVYDGAWSEWGSTVGVPIER